VAPPPTAASRPICLFAWLHPVGGRGLTGTFIASLLFVALIRIRPLIRLAGAGSVVASLRSHQTLVGAVLIILATAASVDTRNFNLLIGPDARQTAAVYRWAAATPPSTLFLIPPEMGDFRLLTERSVVVDYKSIPLGTQALLAWYRLLETVSGQPGFRSAAAARDGYAAMDAARLADLARLYRCDYAVLPNTAETRAMAGEVAFSDPRFLALRCPGVRPDPAGDMPRG